MEGFNFSVIEEVPVESTEPVVVEEVPAVVVEEIAPSIAEYKVPTISLSDILGATEVIRQREEADKTNLNSIANISFENLRTSLIRWAAAGFPPAYTVYEVPISAPDVCSDGVRRDLTDYIVFVTGKSIQEHTSVLQARIVDIVVSFAYSGSSILIVVSKKD